MTKPTIRFKGYTEDWEQRKFGEITELKSASRVHKDEWTSNGVPFYRSSDVMAAINGTENEKAYISEELYEKLSKVSGKLEEGDILVTGGGSVGNPYIVPDNKPLYTKDADLLWIKNKGKFHPYFLYEFFFSPTFRNYLGSISHVGTIAHYTITQLSDTPICLPSFEEQKEVGEYFQSLDNLITLHQRISLYFFKINTFVWEQRKLNEIADKVSEKNKNNEFSEPFTNSAEQGIISQKDYFDREIVNNENLNGYYIVRNDDFIYNPRISVTAPVGPINRNRLGRNGVMSPLYTVFRTHDIDNLYLEFYFKTTKWHRFMKLNGDSGARFDRFTISSTQFMEMPIPYPTLEEQQKIGEYFDSFDNLITLHQRKPYFWNKFIVIDWEQRKLSELATMHARIGWQNLRTSEFLDAGDYMLITGTDFEDGKVNYSTCHYVEKERYDQDKNIQIKNGNILITKDGTLGKVAYVEGLSLPATLNAGVFNVEVKDENETDSKYLFQFLKAPFLMDYVSKKATGGTIKHLNQNILVDFPIATPSKAEQVRIGEYFSNLDNLITLHQRKCEELKNIKKFMLQNMFV